MSSHTSARLRFERETRERRAASSALKAVIRQIDQTEGPLSPWAAVAADAVARVYRAQARLLGEDSPACSPADRTYGKRFVYEDAESPTKLEADLLSSAAWVMQHGEQNKRKESGHPTQGVGLVLYNEDPLNVFGPLRTDPALLSLGEAVTERWELAIALALHQRRLVLGKKMIAEAGMLEAYWVEDGRAERLIVSPSATPDRVVIGTSWAAVTGEPWLALEHELEQRYRETWAQVLAEEKKEG